MNVVGGVAENVLIAVACCSTAAAESAALLTNLLCVEGAVLARNALANNLCVLVYEHGGLCCLRPDREVAKRSTCRALVNTT
jgi:hypothetical protein